MVDLKTETKLNSGESQGFLLWQQQCDCCTEGYCLMSETDSTPVLLWGSQPHSISFLWGSGDVQEGSTPFGVPIPGPSGNSQHLLYFQITFSRALPLSCTPSTSQILYALPRKVPTLSLIPLSLRTSKVSWLSQGRNSAWAAPLRSPLSAIPNIYHLFKASRDFPEV